MSVAYTGVNEDHKYIILILWCGWIKYHIFIVMFVGYIHNLICWNCFSMFRNAFLPYQYLYIIRIMC